MVLTITQQTFDEAVRENIEDLGLDPKEAVTDAIDQFKAQGVDLSNIVTELVGGSQFDTIAGAIAILKENEDPNVLIENLNVLQKECDKGIQYRIHAGREGVYDLILSIFAKDLSLDVKCACMSAMVALMTKQPDLLDSKGADIITKNIDIKTPLELQKLILKWCKESCVMHELNRQKIFELGIVDRIKPLLEEGKCEQLREILAILRVLTLDDDIRIEFGNAHQHAKIIAEETLHDILNIFRKYKNDENLINDSMLTLSSLLVRTEFCRTLEQAGVIELIKEIMLNSPSNEKIIRQSFKLIKALAGNDSCKSHLIQQGLAPVVSICLGNIKDSVPAASAGLNCVAALSLRSPDNSKALYEAEVPEVIVDIMKKHPNEKLIQKPGCWAVRNMVSRSRYQNSHFLELGTEDLLKSNLGKFKEFEYDIKAALRDLNCDVELREEWTGRGGKISSDNIKIE